LCVVTLKARSVVQESSVVCKSVLSCSVLESDFVAVRSLSW
jgi:hypothetical protein